MHVSDRWCSLSVGFQINTHIFMNISYIHTYTPKEREKHKVIKKSTLIKFVEAKCM